MANRNPPDLHVVGSDPTDSLDALAAANTGRVAREEHAKQYFRVLGVDRGRVFFFTARGKQVIEIPVGKLSQKPLLFSLAPLDWWAGEFMAEDGKLDAQRIDMAVDWLLATAYANGVFRAERLRGRGAWWDDGRAVIHAGDRLFVDQQPVDLMDIDSRYVYEQLHPLDVDIKDPLSDKESHRVANFLQGLNWESPAHGVYTVGWMVAALVCGALEWRPHLMLTGPSSAGKSWVWERISRMLGDGAIAVAGDTSAAGIRQRLQQDALAVMFDEFESYNDKTARQINDVIGLSRSSSSGAEVTKGGANGTASTYSLRSCFLFSAIRVPFEQTADENRVFVCSLRANSEQDQIDFKRKHRATYEEIFSPEWAARFRARVIANLATLKTNIDLVADAVVERVGNQRAADGLAPLLAGYALMFTTEELTEERIAKLVDLIDIEDRESSTETKDEEKIVSALLEYQIEVQDGRAKLKISVGEAIERARGLEFSEDLSADACQKALSRHGIRVEHNGIAVSNTHRYIAVALKGTGWSVGWKRIFERVEGAEKFKFASFGGAKSRGVLLPYSAIGDEEVVL